jgi:hypothetical protein
MTSANLPQFLLSFFPILLILRIGTIGLHRPFVLAKMSEYVATHYISMNTIPHYLESMIATAFGKFIFFNSIL